MLKPMPCKYETSSQCVSSTAANPVPAVMFGAWVELMILKSLPLPPAVKVSVDVISSTELLMYPYAPQGIFASM